MRSGGGIDLHIEGAAPPHYRADLASIGFVADHVDGPSHGTVPFSKHASSRKVHSWHGYCVQCCPTDQRRSGAYSHRTTLFWATASPEFSQSTEFAGRRLFLRREVRARAVRPPH
jgi:hypothetical protein